MFECGLCHAVHFALGNDPERNVYNTGYVPRAESIPNFAPASILHADRLAEITHKKPYTTQYTTTGQICWVKVVVSVKIQLWGILLLLLLMLTAIDLSLDGSSPYTSTDKTNKNKYT